jgi:hypothetical protein
MILYIEFLQDLPIPQHGTPYSRRFTAHDGWAFSFSGQAVHLRHPSLKYDFTVFGIPYILLEEKPQAVAEVTAPAITVNTKKGKSR